VSHVGAAHVTIVAFDGIIADTLPLRALALAEAIALECAALDVIVHAPALCRSLMPLLPGRTFNECLVVAVEQIPALQHERFRHDLTAHDIVAIRAQRDWAMAAAHGVPLRDGVLDHMHKLVARGVRIVVRSDSQRREVEPLLRLAGLDDSILFLRCADDLPRRTRVTSVQASYEAIEARLERMRIPWVQRDAVEVPGGTAACMLLESASPRYFLLTDPLTKAL
jgi:beta-phosphoglucomutase-like phosphatase (HAD superfamily)